MNLRIGHGFDVHKLVNERKLILCGVEITHSLGLLGHSDADVATHAVMDAVMGALALGDIGKRFPDNGPQYKNADSLKMLKTLLSETEAANWEIGNLDVTIIAQKPKLSPHIENMRKNIAGIFGVDINRISVKATTTEELGFCGKEKGIAAHAVVLLQQKTGN